LAPWNVNSPFFQGARPPQTSPGVAKQTSQVVFVVNSLPVNVSAVRQFFADDRARDRQSESRAFAGLFGS